MNGYMSLEPLLEEVGSSSGSGSRQVFWIRFQTGFLNPDPDRFSVSGSRRVFFWIRIQTGFLDPDPCGFSWIRIQTGFLDQNPGGFSESGSRLVFWIRIQTGFQYPDQGEHSSGSGSRQAFWIRIQTGFQNPVPDRLFWFWIQASFLNILGPDLLNICKNNIHLKNMSSKQIKNVRMRQTAYTFTVLCFWSYLESCFVCVRRSWNVLIFVENGIIMDLITGIPKNALSYTVHTCINAIILCFNAGNTIIKPKKEIRLKNFKI